MEAAYAARGRGAWPEEGVKGLLLRAQTAEALTKIGQMVAEGAHHYQTEKGAEIPMLAVLSSGWKP